MTGQQIAQAARTQRRVFPRPRRGDKVKSAGFYVLMLAALALAMVALATLLIDVWGDGSSKLSSTLIENQPSKINPASSGLHSALIGTLYLMAICAVFDCRCSMVRLAAASNSSGSAITFRSAR